MSIIENDFIFDLICNLRFRHTKKLRYKKMEILNQSFQYTPSNLFDFIEFI